MSTAAPTKNPLERPFERPTFDPIIPGVKPIECPRCGAPCYRDLRGRYCLRCGWQEGV